MPRRLRSTSTITSSKLRTRCVAVACALILAACSDDSSETRDKDVVEHKSDKTENSISERDQVVAESELSNSALGQLQRDSLVTANNSPELTHSADDPIGDDDSFRDDEISDDELDDSLYEASSRVTFSQEESLDVIRWKAPEALVYTNAKVTISDSQGDYTSRSFGADEAIELYGSLPDGVYSWETVITPELSEYAKEQMREVRQSGNLRAEKELIAQLRADGDLPTREQVEENRQSGNFVVQDGVVRPSQVDGSVTDEGSVE